MQVEHNQAGWGLVARWILACTAGWFLGFLAGFILAGSFEALGMGPVQGVLAYCVLGAGLGCMVGLMQWLVLRNRISGTGWWVMANAVGLAVAGGAGYGVAVLIFGYSEGLEEIGSIAAVLGWTLVVAIGGAVTGVLQWRILRPRVSRAGWWVLASSVGWGLSMAAAGAVMVAGIPALSDTAPIWFLGALVVGGAVHGVATGAALRWILQPG